MWPSIFALIAAAGCHSTSKPPQPVVVVYEDRPVMALASAAPISRGFDAAVLDRRDRQPGAFIGYESLVREYFWLRTDDRVQFGTYGNGFGGGWHDRYERRAVSERVGVIDR